jgi:hypothetical protein
LSRLSFIGSSEWKEQVDLLLAADEACQSHYLVSTIRKQTLVRSLDFAPTSETTPLLIRMIVISWRTRANSPLKVENRRCIGTRSRPRSCIHSRLGYGEGNGRLRHPTVPRSVLGRMNRDPPPDTASACRLSRESSKFTELYGH